MIWSDSIFSAGPGLEMLAKHIAAEIRSAGADFSDDTAMADDGELARSVAEFVARHSPLFQRRPSGYPGFAGGYAEASDGQVAASSPRSAMPEREADNGVLIPSDYLLIMTCRALWAVGQEQTARALLRTKGPELNINESYAAAVFADGLFPWLGRHAALVRALRPSSSAWNRCGPYWILNLQTVFSFLEIGLELTVWRGLYALLKQLAALWDRSSGRGTLGLKNSRFISDNILGLSRQSRPGKRFAGEMLRYCGQALQMAADERGWRCAPAVMDLDA